MKKLDIGDSDYLNDVQGSEEITTLIETIYQAVLSNEDECRNYRDTFMSFSHLWTVMASNTILS